MEYIHRTYRQHFRQDRWKYFVTRYKETDLCIGVDKDSWQAGIPIFADRFVRELRGEMDGWISRRPDYAQALVPCEAGEAPEIFREMSAVAYRSGIGPMSAVAGAFARETGRIITVEEHSMFGGLGGIVAETVVQSCPVPMRILGIPDENAVHGKPLEIFHYYNLDAEGIYNTAKDFVNA